MANDQTQQPTAQPTAQPGGQPAEPAPPPPVNAQAQQGAKPEDDFDGLEGKKPDELTPEELRLMADTMPGEGPGD